MPREDGIPMEVDLHVVADEEPTPMTSPQDSEDAEMAVATVTDLAPTANGTVPMDDDDC